MKKVFSLLILILAIFAGISPSAMAEGVVDDWIYYGDYAYTVQNGQATVVGCRGGHGPDWDDEESGLQDRPGQSDNTATYSNHFDGAIRTVITDRLGGYPVVAIGDYGLAESYARDIILPEGLTSIGTRAFAMCEYTVAITIPESVTFIGENALDDECFATLRVTEGSYAARYAEENGLSYTCDPDYKVFDSGNWLYTLTDGLATIYGYEAYDDYDAFYGYPSDDFAGKLKSIEIPAQLDGHPVTAIKFRGCRYSFTGYDPLYGETLYDSVTIPDSVTEIEGNPFYGMVFSSISASSGNPVYETVDGVLFDKHQKVLIAYPGARTGPYVIPEGTTAIGDEAFWGCEGLTSVSIPSGVIRISEYTFWGCRSLTSVSIPDSVTSIGDAAFYWCESLTSVTIPDSVTEIVGNPFEGCGLTRFVVSPDHTVYEAVDGALFDKQQRILVAYPRARTGEYVIPEGTLAIRDRAFAISVGLTSVTIPSSVTSISGYAFYLCKGLTTVDIPDGVTSIGDHAFILCEGLTSVTIPSSVTNIGDYAFSYCKCLTSVIIPTSVTNIGNSAFSSCESLTGMTIPSSVTSIGEDAFRRSLQPVTLSVTEGSFAEQYAKENEIPFVYTAAMTEE